MDSPRIKFDNASQESSTLTLQSPVERIRETVQLILRVYGKTEKTVDNKRIFIDRQ